jgi:thioredoxin-related protein
MSLKEFRMKRFFLAAALLAAAAPVFAQGPAAAPAQSSIVWEHDLDAALARAKKEHKPIFMDVWTEWCGWCTKLRKEVFPSPQGEAALRDVVPLSICTQKKDGSPTDQKSFEGRFKIEGFPALFILDENGKVLRQFPGYAPPEEFAKFVRGN